MAEPVRAPQTIPSFTLDQVRFQDGQLWRARYPSLIRADLVPSLQFEPAFEVRSEIPGQQVDVVFAIEADQDAVFATTVGEEVSWQSLVPGDPAPDNVTVQLEGEGKKRCRVRCTRSRPRPSLTALRIACKPGIPPPLDDEAAALTQVEGGVYLAILDPSEMDPFERLVNLHPSTEPGRVRVVGFDDQGRPVYDLFEFEETSMPTELAPEPAFRVRHGEACHFNLALDLPTELAQVRFMTKDGEVEMTYVFPNARPEELVETPGDEDNRLCRLLWAAPPCENGATCTQGRVANLYAQLDSGELGDPLRKAIAKVRIDPTVIEPPPCDASGICTTPRVYGDGGTTTPPTA